MLHIRKLCVGAESIEDLQTWQAQRLAKTGGLIWHRTRTWPRRHAEILGGDGGSEENEGGGSLYWIIKGAMACRQRIIGFEAESHEDPDERPYCRILLDPVIVPTDPWPHRPFQGWRYLKPEEAPPDLVESADDDALPTALTAELRALGVW